MAHRDLVQEQRQLCSDAASGDRTAARRLLALLFDGWEQRDAGFDGLVDALVEHARSGSEAALELVLTVTHQLGLARPAITRLIIDPVVVDEVAQSTLVKVEMNLSRFEGRSKFRTWLYTVARNEALMHLRREKVTAAESDPDELAADPGRRMSSVIATRVTVREALESLPEPYRETMLLRTGEQLDYEEIAAALAVPVGTVRSRLAKARDMLAAELDLV